MDKQILKVLYFILVTVDNATNMDIMEVKFKEKLQYHSPLPVNDTH